MRMRMRTKKMRTIIATVVYTEDSSSKQRLLEMAGKILENLQKSIVDDTISSAAGLERDSHSKAYRTLPYYESQSQLSD